MKLNTRALLPTRPLNRPKVSFNVDDDMSSSKDSDSSPPLPIVELKPFVQKVWRREKSLPSFYNNFDSSYGNGRNSTGSRSKEPEIEVEVKPVEEFSPPPPRTSHSLPSSFPSQRLLQFQMASPTNEPRMQREPSVLGVSQDQGMRPKSRIHPPVDSRTERQPEHAVSLIPGFITREDREKTTLIDISEGDFTNRSYSCSPKTVRQEDMKRFDDIRVKGENVTRVLHPKSYTCPNSWRATGSFQGVRHGSPASMLYYHKTSHQRPKKKSDTDLYDHLDRKGVLPSLTVQAKSLKKRASRNFEENVSEDYRDYREAYEANSRHNIGGIENSLKVLSEQGAPTKIERMLSFQLEMNLSRFRTLKDYSPLETSPSELAKYYSTPTFNLTQGEVDIRKGLHSNTTKNKRAKLRNINPLSRENLMTFTTTADFQRLHHRKTQLFDQLRALENRMPDYGVFERNDSRGMSNPDKTAMTATEDELVVPNDTPRSYLDSRISFKPTEVAIEEQSKETQTSPDDVSEEDLPQEVTKVGKDQDRTTQTKSPRKGKMAQRLEINPENIDSKLPLTNGVAFDSEGKTFLTSDTRAHITVTG